MAVIALMMYDGLYLNAIMKPEYAAWDSVFAITQKPLFSVWVHQPCFE